jgi:ankyrin repeat protein
LEALLRHGADINARTDYGLTALAWAVVDLDVPAVTLLLRHRARTSIADKEGDTPLHRAAGWSTGDVIIGGIEGSAMNIVRLLLDHGAPLEARNNAGQTPLMMAALYGHVDTFRLLASRGAELDAADKRGRTALTFAARRGRLDAIVQFLVEHEQRIRLIDALLMRDFSAARKELNAGLEVPGPNGETPLMVAAEFGEIDLVRDLLDRGANIRAADDRGLTALFFAVGGTPSDNHQAGRRYWTRNIGTATRHEIVRLLLDRGAHADVVDGRRESPLSVALDVHDADVVDMLRTTPNGR